MLTTTACGAHEQRNAYANDSVPPRVARPVSDCLGPDSVVAISVGHVGSLRLDLPLDSLRRRCPSSRDTTANGDEELDTAIVIARPGLRLVGKLAQIEGEDGRQSVHVTDADKVQQWMVIGSAGLLPRTVPLTATWRMLVSAYGPVTNQSGSNGDVFLSFCSMPGFVFSMAVPFAALVDTVNIAAAESTRLASPIAAVYVPTAEPVTHSPCRT